MINRFIDSHFQKRFQKRIDKFEVAYLEAKHKQELEELEERKTKALETIADCLSEILASGLSIKE